MKVPKTVIILILLVAIIYCKTSAPSKISDFEIKYFKVIRKRARMHPIDVGFTENDHMYLGAFGDLNGDRLYEFIFSDL